jgi:hypothetical protein
MTPEEKTPTAPLATFVAEKEETKPQRTQRSTESFSGKIEVRNGFVEEVV